MLALALLPLPVAAAEEGHVYQDQDTGAGFLGGRYLELGVTPYGTLGAASTAGERERWHGLIEEYPADAVGLRFNAGGSWSAKAEDTGDFVLYGAVEEGFCIGRGLPLPEEDLAPLAGMQEMLAVHTTDCRGGVRAEAAAAVQARTDVRQKDGRLLAETVLTSPGLHLVQEISFAAGDAHYRTAVTITNTSAEPYERLTYLRSFNPDQGGRWGDGSTRNHFLINSLGEDSRQDVLSGTLISAGTDLECPDPWTAADPFFYYIPYRSAYAVRPLQTGSGTMHFHEARVREDGAGSRNPDEGIGFAVQFERLEPGESCGFTWYGGAAAMRETVERIAGAAKRSGFWLDFAQERLGGLEADTLYTIAGAADDSVRRSDADGCLPLNLPADLSGQRITVRDTNNSLDIPARPLPPAAPVLLSRTADTLVLEAAAGCELSLDQGGTWQPGEAGRTVFSGLRPGTDYAAVQRTAATGGAFASLPSEAAVFSTLALPGGKSAGGPGFTYVVPPTAAR